MVKDGEDKHGLQIGDELKKHRLNFSKRANRDVVPLILLHQIWEMPGWLQEYAQISGSIHNAPEICENAICILACTDGAFRNWWRHDDTVISQPRTEGPLWTGLVICLPEAPANTNLKWPLIGSFSNFSRRSVDGKNLMRFQSETSVFKFLRHSMNGDTGWRNWTAI